MGYFDLTIDEMGPDVVVITLLSDEALPDDIVRLRETLKSRIKDGYRRFVLDCRAMRYFTSAFIGAVLETSPIAHERKTVAIVGTDRHAEILETFRLNKLLSIHGDVREALDAVRAEGGRGLGSSDAGEARSRTSPTSSASAPGAVEGENG